MERKFEYFILFLITGFIGMKSLAIYDTNEPFTQPESKYLYLAAICIICCLYSAAKYDLFNVFVLIRKTPNSIRQLYNHMKNDYISWKKTGVRNGK